MAKEFGERRIRANAVSPGAIRPELGGGLGAEFETLLASQTALRRVGQPDEVGRAIANLLSEDSGWIGARTIEVAGGYVIWRGTSMLDHIFLTVSDLSRSVAFYGAVLPKLGIAMRHGYDGRSGPPGHPDLEGFGANGRMFFWLREGRPHPEAVHVGFVAHSEAEVRQAYEAAIAAGATDNVAAGGVPGARLHYDPRYYAANVLDPDGYSLEFVHKPWQRPQRREKPMPKA